MAGGERAGKCKGGRNGGGCRGGERGTAIRLRVIRHYEGRSSSFLEARALTNRQRIGERDGGRKAKKKFVQGLRRHRIIHTL